jgi:hypothetical protein
MQLIDERNGAKVFLADATTPGVCQCAFDFLGHLQNRCDAIIGHIGGPLRIFEPKVPVSKSRCIGAVYDDLKQLLRLTPRGTAAASREFLAELGTDLSTLTFQQIRVAEDRQIEIATL